MRKLLLFLVAFLLGVIFTVAVSNGEELKPCNFYTTTVGTACIMTANQQPPPCPAPGGTPIKLYATDGSGDVREGRIFIDTDSFPIVSFHAVSWNVELLTNVGEFVCVGAPVKTFKGQGTIAVSCVP